MELLKQLLVQRNTVIRLRKQIARTPTQGKSGIAQDSDQFEELSRVADDGNTAVEGMDAVERGSMSDQLMGEEPTVAVEKQTIPTQGSVEKGIESWDTIQDWSEDYWAVLESGLEGALSVPLFDDVRTA